MRSLRLALLVVTAALSITVGCTRSDGLYCDENTPCTDPSRPFCDLQGSFPASSGVGRTCIADPNVDRPDGGEISDPDAAPPMCVLSSECPASVPVCQDGSCATCTLGEGGDSECVQRDANLPVCGASGRCQECNSNSDCAGNAPICDLNVGSCQACSTNLACDSGACNFDTGACVSADDIIYADVQLGNDGPSCGAQPGSGACKHIAGAQGALAKVTAARKIVVMAVGSYIEDVEIVATEVQIIGNNARLVLPSFLLGPALAIRGGAQVSISDLRIEGGNTITEGSGISCAASNLELREVTLQNNEDAGLTAFDCALDIRDSVVINNDLQGLDIGAGSALDLHSSVIQSNGFQGLLASDSILQIERNIFIGNTAGGLSINRSSFSVENNIIVKNGNASANPAFAAGGIAITNGSSVAPQILLHNTIADNNSSANNESAGLVCNSLAAVSAVSNIIVDNLRPGSDPQFSGNCSLSFSNVGGITSGTGNIDVPPSFVNAAAGDYHLAAGSAGIDLGSASVSTSLDIDGDARPQGAGYDMGADERL